MLESIILLGLAEIATIIIVALICRATGKRLPEWVAGKRVARWLNHWIAGDPKRLDRLITALGLPG